MKQRNTGINTAKRGGERKGGQRWREIKTGGERDGERKLLEVSGNWR